MSNDGLVRRALAAYFRGGDTDPPSSADIEELGGKRYVVLRKGARLLACYRVRNDEKLKRLRRVPME